MANIAAWFIFALGIGHIIYGLVKFRSPLAAAVSAGFVGQFEASEIRCTAFWFVMFGLLLTLTGQTAVHAVASGDLALLKVIGFYALITSVIGVSAFPKSPFWAPLFVSPLVIAAGYGFFP